MKVFNILITLLILPFHFFSLRGNIGQAISIYETCFTIIFLFFFIRKGEENLKLLIGLYFISLPIISIARGSFFTYNIHFVLLVIITTKLYFMKYNYFKRNYLSGIYSILLLFGIIYYLSSFLNTGKYFINIRIFELLLTAGLVPFIFVDKKLTLNILVFLFINSILLVQLGTNDESRLLINTSDGNDELHLGGNNPISYGLPISFCLLTMISYGFKFRNVLGKIFYIMFIVIGLVFLILTTSRASILALALGFFIYYGYKHQVIGLLKIIIIILIISFSFNFLAQHNKYLAFSYKFLIERTEENQDNLNKISSGRIEQWIAVGDYIINSPGDLILGFGPGMQKEAFAIISSSTDNKKNASFVGIAYAFHALPLQMIVEIGLIGTIFFYFFIFLILIRSIKFMKISVYPVIAWVAFFSIGLSVSSFDVFSGLFLGISLIPIFYKNINYARFNKQEGFAVSPSPR